MFYKAEVAVCSEIRTKHLNADASIKKREDQLRRKTRGLRTRVAKCTEF
jgi:hypothetical protein